MREGCHVANVTLQSMNVARAWCVFACLLCFCSARMVGFRVFVCLCCCLLFVVLVCLFVAGLLVCLGGGVLCVCVCVSVWVCAVLRAGKENNFARPRCMPVGHHP